MPAAATSENDWIMGSAPSWVTITPTSGEAGETAIGVIYDTANPGAARTGQLRIENTTTHEIAICLITRLKLLCPLIFKHQPVGKSAI